MDWKDLAGPLIGSGAPILGKIIGGLLPVPGGALLGEAAGNVLAKALGVAPTPEAVSDALHNDSSDITLAKVKAAESEAVAKWPALADMAKAQHEAETAQFHASLIDLQSARTRDIDVRKLDGGVNTRANVLVVLAFALLLAIVVFIFVKITDLSQPGTIAVLTFLTTIAGNITQWIGNVFNFEFGTSRGSSDKTNQLVDLANKAVAANTPK